MEQLPPSHFPLHGLDDMPFPAVVQDLNYRNPYDFGVPHRHAYFEIIVFDKGGGHQLIDFIEFPVKSKSAYIIFPKQIHLLRRAEDSQGLLIQFKPESVPSTRVQEMLNEFLHGHEHFALFEDDEAKCQDVLDQLQAIRAVPAQYPENGLEIIGHLLQCLLLKLLEGTAPSRRTVQDPLQRLVLAFQQEVEQQYMDVHIVAVYLDKLACSEKKLARATQIFLGCSPLKVIHERLLLEAKRLLLFAELSHKEIAFRLGFDSPASFSHFIKKKTGLTAGELSERLTQIHK